MLNLKEVLGMKLALQHKKCLFSQAPCLLRTTRQVKIDQKHPIAKMTPFIQILMMFLLEWREVIPLMAVLIPTKTQGKQSLVKWALVAHIFIHISKCQFCLKWIHYFSRNLPPSQGGRYSGFGNQVESGPPRSSSVTDFYEGSVNGLTSVSFLHLLWQTEIIENNIENLNISLRISFI